MDSFLTLIFNLCMSSSFWCVRFIFFLSRQLLCVTRYQFCQPTTTRADRGKIHLRAHMRHFSFVAFVQSLLSVQWLLNIFHLCTSSSSSFSITLSLILFIFAVFLCVFSRQLFFNPLFMAMSLWETVAKNSSIGSIQFIVNKITPNSLSHVKCKCTTAPMMLCIAKWQITTTTTTKTIIKSKKKMSHCNRRQWEMNNGI